MAEAILSFLDSMSLHDIVILSEAKDLLFYPNVTRKMTQSLDLDCVIFYIL